MQVAVFVDGKFRCIAEAPSTTTAVAFAQGYCAAAQQFMQTVSLYILPNDQEEMLRDEDQHEAWHALREAGSIAARLQHERDAERATDLRADSTR